MDRLIYTAMTGAKHALSRQDTLSHNLANASTPGYRADTTAFRAVPIRGEGGPTRVFAIESTPGANFAPGSIQQTARDLDVALNGRGWFAVESRNGTEAYTRAGSFETDANGMLVTRGGLPVLGDGGPIVIPADSRVSIAKDGTISAIPNAGPLTNVQVVGRLKLVDPPEASLVKGGDGLFRTRDGVPAVTDETLSVTAGSLEGSNVNVVEAMVGIIAVARQFEVQMKILQTAEADSRAATQLVSVSG